MLSLNTVLIHGGFVHLSRFCFFYKLIYFLWLIHKYSYPFVKFILSYQKNCQQCVWKFLLLSNVLNPQWRFRAIASKCLELQDFVVCYSKKESKRFWKEDVLLLSDEHLGTESLKGKLDCQCRENFVSHEYLNEEK